ncbi:glycoside hydrolase family 127 protein [Cohnella rhizosphaerae]|uniref:hypothetical protein n=1 Tax=Cohnella rhizosphaerae TaxID=1457232 RepID=UPI0030B8B770
MKLKQTTNYPWDGRIELAVHPEREESFVIRLRVPDWCRGYKLKVGGERLFGAGALTDRGYLIVDRKWSQGDVIVLELDMPVEVVRAREAVEADRGRLAIQRGPIVYCAEQADNPDLTYDAFALAAREPLNIHYRPDLLGGVTVLTGLAEEGKPCLLIPYYAWDNREEGFMQVWIREAEDRRLYLY